MTNKQRLQTLLDGGTPDVPPTWELVFQIQEAMFGMEVGGLGRDSFGSDAAWWEALVGHHVELAQLLIEECGWAAIPGPNPYDPGFVAEMKRRIGDQALIPGFEGGGVFWMPSGSDMMDFAIRLYEQRDDLLAEARAKCDAAKDALRRLAAAGADFFVLTYDFGFNDAPFVSPAHFGEIVVPFLTEIVETAHELGKKAILHSDGCLNAILDQIHGTGLDGYQSVDPQGHMEIRAVRELYPDWILMGNVACSLLQDVDEGKIRGAVQDCMEHGGVGKRYIFSTSNCIFEGMPPESYRIMLDEYRRAIGRRVEKG